MGFMDYARWLPFGVVVSLQLFAFLVLLSAHLLPSAYVAKHSWSYTLLNVIVTLALGAGSIGCYLLATLMSPGHPRKGGLEAALGLNDVPGETVWDAEQGEARQDGWGASNTSYPAADEDGPSAPLLLSQSIPGQPRLPSRTGRSQLDELSRLGDRAEGLDAGVAGIVRMADMQVKSSGEKRWCNKCNAPKPDRAHHCSSCGTCILRMDHHCPWLASRCIGLRNHKAFFLFLFYTSLFCAWAAQDMARMLLGFVEAEPNGFETSPISWAIVFFIAFIFGMALIPFTGYHAYLLMRNRTTIESMEGSGRIRIKGQPTDPQREAVSDRLRRLAGGHLDSAPGRAGGGGSSRWRDDDHLTREERRALKQARKLNIYDVGWSRNWRSIMGERWWMWLLPLGEPDSDGFEYLVNAQTLAKLHQATSSIRQGGGGGGNDEDRDRADARPPPARQTGQRFRSAHGNTEWGPRPKKDFVLYGVGDDSEDEGTTRAEAQQDADVWRD